MSAAGDAKALRRAQAEYQRVLKRGNATNALSMSCLHALSLHALLLDEGARVSEKLAPPGDAHGTFLSVLNRSSKELTVSGPSQLSALITAFYISLNVVIEGWQDPAQPSPRLSDPRVDALLQSPHVKLLREFRHARAHPNPLLDKRFLAFGEAHGEIVQWAVEVLGAFRDYFVRWHVQLDAAAAAAREAAARRGGS